MLRRETTPVARSNLADKTQQAKRGRGVYEPARGKGRPVAHGQRRQRRLADKEARPGGELVQTNQNYGTAPSPRLGACSDRIFGVGTGAPRRLPALHRRRAER